MRFYARRALQSGGVSAILLGRVDSHTGRTSEAREKSWRLIRTTRRRRIARIASWIPLALFLALYVADIFSRSRTQRR